MLNDHYGFLGSRELHKIRISVFFFTEPAIQLLQLLINSNGEDMIFQYNQGSNAPMVPELVPMCHLSPKLLIYSFRSLNLLTCLPEVKSFLIKFLNSCGSLFPESSEDSGESGCACFLLAFVVGVTNRHEFLSVWGVFGLEGKVSVYAGGCESLREREHAVLPF